METQAAGIIGPAVTGGVSLKWPTNNNNNYTNNNNDNNPRQVTTISIYHQPQMHPLDKEPKYYQPQCNGTSGSSSIIGKCSVVVSSEQMSGIDEDSSAADAEVSNFTSDTVNLRSKKKKGEELRESIERPMSWEGELSDSEMTTIKPDPEDSSMEGVQSHSNSTCSTIIGHPDDEKPQPLKFTNESDKVMEQLRASNLSSQADLPLLMDKLLSNGYNGVLKGPGPTPSPDSAVYSCYSPAASPVASRHNILSSSSGISSPFTPSLSRNNSDASQYGGSQHSSCYSHSYSSVSESPTQFSPTHSPIQGRHIHRPGYPSPILSARTTTAGVHDYSMQGPSKNSKLWPFRPRRVWKSLEKIWKPSEAQSSPPSTKTPVSDIKAQQPDDKHESGASVQEEKLTSLTADIVQHSAGLASPGISRQQLINSPCPICGDKISGFHYGIFSCESCKGFFKRTVQNRKNYVCLRGSSCPVTITTRKKCPACRFEKCLSMGMKLEAIREDRTRGGRSTYQCSYTVPVGLVGGNGSGNGGGVGDQASKGGGGGDASTQPRHTEPSSSSQHSIPTLLQEIMEVEHLWQYNETEAAGRAATTPAPASPSSATHSTNTPDLSANLCNIADHRLYKIVKWCKSLPLFKNISIDDQISLLINAWCELLLFSCCFRSMSSPGEIRVSLGKCISLSEARKLGLGPPIERMLNFTEHLRRLRVDRYEYVAMKVIVLLTSDASDLREPEKVRASQETALQALQQYTSHHYPDIPSKFGELLLRIPDLQRTCQVGKEMLTIKSKEGEGPSFNLLMELLRGDH